MEEFQVSSSSTLEPEIHIPDPQPESPNPTETELIFLELTFQFRRTLLTIEPDGTETLQWQNDGVQVPISDHTLPLRIFDDGHDAVSRFLSDPLRTFHEEIDVGAVIDKLITQWVQIRDEVDSRSFDGVLEMGLNLVFWEIERSYRFEEEDEVRMVPASDLAVKEMLEKVRIEDIVGGVDECCVICLEKLKKMKRVVYALRMPCLHVFHRGCVLKWLKNSHYCPVCRFQLPTD